MKILQTNILEVKPVASVVLAALVIASSLVIFTATAATENSITVEVSRDNEMSATIHIDNEETTEQLDTTTESRAIAVLAEELDMSWEEVAQIISFEYERLKPTDFDSTVDYQVDTLVIGGNQTLVELWIGGVYYDYWIDTINVRTAIEEVSDIYRIPDRIFYDELLENSQPASVVVYTYSDEDDGADEAKDDNNETSTQEDDGLLFYVYQGTGKAAVMVYQNGTLKESYTYESDNKSEIVSQLALRYSMTESELESRTLFESDGVDDVDIENLEGRDDNLDPHEGDDRPVGNQTPVAGY